MTNEEKSKKIAEECGILSYYGFIKRKDYNKEECVKAAMKMAKWKDEQLYLLIDAIDHAYLKTDGTYGDLSYEVSDKVKYLKSSLKQPIK